MKLSADKLDHDEYPDFPELRKLDLTRVVEFRGISGTSMISFVKRKTEISLDLSD